MASIESAKHLIRARLLELEMLLKLMPDNAAEVKEARSGLLNLASLIEQVLNIKIREGHD